MSEQSVRKLHAPVEIEPSDTICGECSWRLPNGKFFGKVVEYPCPTLDALDEEPNESTARSSLTEPTDAQVIEALNAWHQDVMPANRLGVFGTWKEDRMRAALKAAFTAGQEDKP